MSGTLYVVATPIGNLEDITLRAVRILREADGVLAEDTRHTGKLLKHLGVETRMTSLHGHNEKGRVDRVLGWLGEGQTLALVSDAGTPAISDPGAAVVAAARDAGHKVSPVPGACAFVAAACAAGLPTDKLHFVGFLPGRPGRRKKVLGSVVHSGGTTCVWRGLTSSSAWHLRLAARTSHTAAQRSSKAASSFFVRMSIRRLLMTCANSLRTRCSMAKGVSTALTSAACADLSTLLTATACSTRHGSSVHALRPLPRSVFTLTLHTTGLTQPRVPIA